MPKPDPPNPADILEAEEVAALLKIGKSTVYTMRRTGELVGFTIGESVRFRRADVDRYIDQRIAADNPHLAAAD